MLIMLGTGAIMWNEREMPARWYELLRERMQVEQLRMRIVKHGYLIEDYELQELLTEAHSLDSEMLRVMRQTIAEALAGEEVLRPTARAHQLVGFIDEQNDRLRRALHLVDDRLQAILEFPLHRRPCL